MTQTNAARFLATNSSILSGPISRVSSRVRLKANGVAKLVPQCGAVSLGHEQQFAGARGGLPLHLCEAAVHSQFRSRDVAAVVGCEKHHGLGDHIRRAEPAERS